MTASRCPACGEETTSAGRKFGKFSNRWYGLFHCPACRFSFVGDPWTDFAAIYSEAYYSGKGADPLVNYDFELHHPTETVRIYEWEGLFEVVSKLTPVAPQTKWLDFGCGNGGLVRHVQQSAKCQVFGFDEGSIVNKARNLGLPLLTPEELECHRGTFDIVTAVEVLEHTIDPRQTLGRIRDMLKPRGLLFLTTGNARPFRGKLSEWNYVIPEIHVSFFEPETLARLLTVVGFRPEFAGFLPGFKKSSDTSYSRPSASGGARFSSACCPSGSSRQ